MGRRADPTLRVSTEWEVVKRRGSFPQNGTGQLLTSRRASSSQDDFPKHLQFLAFLSSCFKHISKFWIVASKAPRIKGAMIVIDSVAVRTASDYLNFPAKALDEKRNADATNI
jgi:hypothetical protein